MSERNEARKEQYKRARTDFEDLEIEDKAVFLLEATVTTIARGIEQFGRVVSDQINDAFGRRAERRASTEQSTGAAPDPAPGSTSDPFTGGTS
jgi:hypothetical protein